MNQNRVNKIIQNMNDNNLKQILVTSTASIFYLTGKWIEPGERMLALYINSNGNTKFFVNALFPIEEDLGVDMEVYSDSEDPIERLLPFIDENEVLGIDKQWPSHFLISLMNKNSNLKFKDGSSVVDEARMVKDNEEIELMIEASKVNDKAMEELIRDVIPKNITENKACKLLGDIYEKYETHEFSFYPLIAYGKNAAEPHHSSDDSKLEIGDSIILDIGGKTNFYCSDMTRTVFFGKPKEEYIKIYNTVLEANLKAIEAVKPGVRFCDVDKVARDVITKAGYGEYFTHRTGHNAGIDVHEFPDVGANNEMLIKEGMIFSIEPGIYIQGKVGVRIEDLVLVTKDGCKVLNSYPKELQIIE